MKEDELFKTISNQTSRNIYTSATRGKYLEKPAKEELANKITLGLLALFIFAGGEILKITFRKDFGRGQLNQFKIIVGFIGLLGVSLINFLLFFDESSTITVGYFGMIPLFATGLLYLIFAVFIIVKGMADLNKSNKPKNANKRAISYLFTIKGWKVNNVQTWLEPSFLLIIGIVYLPFNFLCGLPLIFCALSYWLHSAYVYFTSESDHKDSDNLRGFKTNTPTTYYEAKF